MGSIYSQLQSIWSQYTVSQYTVNTQSVNIQSIHNQSIYSQYTVSQYTVTTQQSIVNMHVTDLLKLCMASAVTLLERLQPEQLTHLARDLPAAHRSTTETTQRAIERQDNRGQSRPHRGQSRPHRGHSAYTIQHSAQDCPPQHSTNNKQHAAHSTLHTQRYAG